MTEQKTLADCRLMDLPRIEFREGNLTPLEGSQLVPFDIKRVFYIYDIPSGESRGAHAHKTCHQLIIAASGSFEVAMDDGHFRQTVTLNRPFQGLYVPPGIWCREQAFSSGSVCLVLTSDFFDENDYIRDYNDYLAYVGVRTDIGLPSGHAAGITSTGATTVLAGTGVNPLVEFYDLRRITERHRTDIDQAISRVIDSGWFLLGKEVTGFEQHYGGFIGTSHCVGVGNGLDALKLIFRAYKEMQVLHDGDEVIVPANTYIASILAITENNLTPVLVEPDRQTLQLDDSLIEQAITPLTKAILLVHLYGRNAYTARIGDICQQHHLKLIEDNAQAAGCCYTDFSNRRPVYRRTGSLGDAAGHSFYPTKNLGALGDGGAVTTNDPELAGLIRSLANYGSSKKYVFPYQGLNSRLDELHAAVLDAKLSFLDAENDRRREVARYYCEHLHHPAIEIPGLTSQLDPTTHMASQSVTAARQSGQLYDLVTQPFVASLSDRANSYHLFPILTPHRDALQQYLLENGVQTQIHYPVPPHKQACFKAWNDRSYPITEEIHALELSLPMSPLLTEAELQQVVGLLNNWKG